MFKVGDKVRWESHGGSGFYPTGKIGRIFKIVPGNCFPSHFYIATKRGADYRLAFPRHIIMFSGYRRNYKSYLVEIEFKYSTRNGEKTCLKLYWPRVSQLRLVEESNV